MKSWLLALALVACPASAQRADPPPQPERELYFILGGAFLPCPLGRNGESDCAKPMAQVWSDATSAGKPLRALTSEGRSVHVKLTGFRRDEDLDQEMPVLEPPKGLRKDERVLLVWNTDDAVELVETRPYAATAEQQALVAALSVVQHMPTRWRRQNFGSGELAITDAVFLDPSAPGNLRARYFDAGEGSTFFMVQVSARVDDHGSQYFEDHLGWLLVVDRFTGENTAAGVEPPYFLLRVRGRLLVATPSTGHEEVGVNLSELAQAWQRYGAYPDSNPYVMRYTGKMRVSEQGWSSGSLTAVWSWDAIAEAFRWPAPLAATDIPLATEDTP